MILPYFQNLAAGLEAKLAASPPEIIARKRFALEIANLGIRLFSGKERVAWCGVLAPFDLLQAMGVTSCFAEFVGALLAGTGAVETFLTDAEDAGYSTDGCSYHRAVLGAARQGLMPDPDFLIGTTAPCTGGLAVIENLAQQFKKDLFVLHIPHTDDETAVSHLAAELEQMVAFVSEHTGEPLGPARLSASIRNTNRMRDAMLQTYASAAQVPSPARTRDLVNYGIVMSLLLGTDTGVEVAETYRDELARKVAQGIAGRPNEQLRLLWLQNRVQFKTPLESLIEEEHGAAIVVDEFNDITWDAIDPDDPYPGLARRILSICFVGPATGRITNLQRLAREYKVDGAINPCQWGCRQGAGARGLVADGLKEIGVPVLNLEVDCVDPRNFAEGQLRTRLEAFLEMLSERRD